MKTNRTFPVVVALALGLSLWIIAADPATPLATRYTPESLLTYRGDDSSTIAIKTPADWPKRRAQILKSMELAMGPLPDLAKLPPLDVKVLSEEKGPEFVRQSIEYTADTNAKSGKPERVPAYLFLPTNLKPGEKRPAILALHPTSKLGKAEITGAGKPNREYGLELAKRGYVVICPDYPSFGDYQKDFAASNYPSGTMQGIVNHIRAVDLLVSRPEVDGERIGVIGHSLGGHNSLFAAVFDPRIKAVVTSCGWNVFEDYYKGNLTGWSSDRYMPRIKSEYGVSPAKMPFDFHEVLAAIAPRPVLSISPLKDSNFEVDGVRKGLRAAKAVYTLLDAPDALQAEHPDCAHDFPPDMREKAYTFLDAVLKTANPKSQDPKSNGPQSRPDLAAELPRVPAKSPAEAEKCIKCIPGYTAKLVASEPLVFSPVAIDFDENGRAFVCEMIDYPFVAAEPMGKIAILEDTNDDGVYDKRTVLADKIPWPTAVVCYDGGCFVGSAPDVLYIKDTGARPSPPGPGTPASSPAGRNTRPGEDAGVPTADVRKVVFTGFGKQNVQGLLNCFRWGIDNRIHGATSSNGGHVRRADLPENDPKNSPVNLSGRDFSFDPRLLDLRPESGGGQHGMCFDDFGRKFVCSNSDHLQQIVYDDRYAGRNPNVQLPPARVSIAADGPQAEVFRISPVEGWRIVRTRMRVSGEVKGPIEGGGRAAGYFTGATGVTIYRGDACPDLRGQAFIGDVGSNLVSRKVLKPTDGVLFRGERIDQGVEFLASTDIWFRPAQFANAPDGTLYVLDVCRETIEHPASLPDVIKQYLDLTNGRDRGRIYRVVPDGFKQGPVPKLGTLSTAELVALLKHRNGWHRDTASRLLYERQDKSRVKDLELVAQNIKDPEAKLHALYTLASLGSLTAEQIDTVRHDAPLSVVPRLLRLAEGINDANVRKGIYLGEFGRQPVTPEADLQRALTLGSLSGVTPAEETARDQMLMLVLQMRESDPYIRSAVFSSLGNRMTAVASALVADAQRRTPERKALLRSVAKSAALSGDPAVVGELIEILNHLANDQADADVVRQIVAGLADGSGKGAEKLRVVLSKSAAAPVLAELLKDARRVVDDPAAKPTSRVEAIRHLGLDSFAEVRDLLAARFAGREPQEVQLAAVAALDAFSEPEVGDVLTKAWPRLTPRVRAAAIDVLLARPNRAVAFLTAIQQEKVPAADLDSARLKRLQASKDAKVRELANAVAKRLTLSPRNDVIAAYKKSLDLKGDRDKGKAIFTQTCITCHRLENAGTEIGPNLAAMQARGAEAILVNVLDPNREVNGQFVEYVVDTKDGRTISGVLSSETAAAVTLLKPGGATETVARTEIEKLRSTGLSLMPEGLERQVIDPQQMADLIAYLMTAK